MWYKFEHNFGKIGLTVAAAAIIGLILLTAFAF